MRKGDTKESWAQYMKEYTRQLRIKVLEVMGDECARCSFKDYRALQVDHINGGGVRETKLRGSNGTAAYWREVLKSLATKEGKYQLLCANCNWIKRFERGEVKS